jgi:nickel superoxide dismutase
MNHNFLKTLLLFSLITGPLFAHCQMPCGIYNDAARIIQIQEDFSTIKKAMTKIKELSQQQDATSMNQLTRWIITKEDHASKIQNVVSDYFLTQRIKAKTEGSEFDTYVKQTTTLHQILVSAMKCKQTVDLGLVDEGLHQIEAFINLYFETHGKEHIKQLNESY